MNVIYFVVFWIGVGLVSIDENVKLGEAYALYICSGAFINVFGSMFYSVNKD